MSFYTRLLVAVGLAGAAAALWITTYDASTLGEAVLGGYRERWFLIAAAVSWATGLAALGLVVAARDTWFKIITIHLGLFLTIGMLEAVAFAGLVDYREILLDPNTLYTSATKRDSRLRFSLRPDIRSEGKTAGDLTRLLGAPAVMLNYRFESDGNGLRNPREKPDARIALLGDSILVAGLLSIEDIVTERLERGIGRAVLNVSVTRTAPQEQLAIFDLVRPEPACHVVLHFLFEGNDLTDSMTWRKWFAAGSRHYPRSGLIKTVMTFLKRPKRGVGTQDRHGSFRRADGGREEVYFLYDASKIASTAAEFELMGKDLAIGHRALREAGARVAVVVVPAKLSVVGSFIDWPDGAALADPTRWRSSFAESARSYAAREDLPFHDLTGDLRAAARNGVLPYFPTDTHLNADGHRIMAAALAPLIEQLRSGTEDDGCAP